MPRDWLGRMSPGCPILCRVERKTLIQSISQPVKFPFRLSGEVSWKTKIKRVLFFLSQSVFNYKDFAICRPYDSIVVPFHRVSEQIAKSVPYCWRQVKGHTGQHWGAVPSWRYAIFTTWRKTRQCISVDNILPSYEHKCSGTGGVENGEWEYHSPTLRGVIILCKPRKTNAVLLNILLTQRQTLNPMAHSTAYFPVCAPFISPILKLLPVLLSCSFSTHGDE